MFNFGKKAVGNDPKKALQGASDMLNKGIFGAIAKTFMGKDFVNQMNADILQGNQAIDSIEKTKAVAQNGVDATAEVLTVQDTGATVNMDPVVLLELKVTSSLGNEFKVTAQAMVSRIAIPRAGDKIKIKYNPENTSEIVLV